MRLRIAARTATPDGISSKSHQRRNDVATRWHIRCRSHNTLGMLHGQKNGKLHREHMLMSLPSRTPEMRVAAPRIECWCLERDIIVAHAGWRNLEAQACDKPFGRFPPCSHLRDLNREL